MKGSPGRKNRRNLDKARHCNAFCKKYASYKWRLRAFQYAGIGIGKTMLHESMPLPTRVPKGSHPLNVAKAFIKHFITKRYKK